MLAVLPAIGYLHDHGLDLLRLQARQRDPRGRRGEADRPRRRAPHGTTPTPPSSARSATRPPRCRRPVRPSPATSTPSDGRCAVLILDWPGWTDDRRRAAARPRRARRARRARLPVAVPRAGVRPRSGRAVPRRRRDGRRPARRAVPGRGGGRRHPAPADQHPLQPTAAPASTALGWQALPGPLLPNHPRLANRVAGVADGDPEAVARHGGRGRRGAQLGRHRPRWPGPTASWGDFGGRRHGDRAARPGVARGGPRSGPARARQRPVLPPSACRPWPPATAPGRRFCWPTPTPPRPGESATAPGLARAALVTSRRRRPAATRPPTCSSRWR